jgi:general secretion pathway protein F/type IV pilus assembly protein PilC
MDRPYVASKIKDMVFDIRSGKSFSEAAERHQHIFPRTVIHLIRLGERTGQLAERLKDASEHLKRIQKIVSDTKQALLYPCFVLTAMGAGFLFWFYYVVPKIVGLFEEMDVSLPALTLMILKVSNVVQTHMVIILSTVATAGLLAAAAYRGNGRVRKATALVLLRLPISRTLFSASNLAFVSEHLSLLLHAGIDVVQSVAIMGNTVKNELYREKLATVHELLGKGEGISESFRRGDVFPKFVVRMIKVGEESGNLTEQLSYIAEDYRNRLSELVATLGKIIEPAVLVIAGTMFAIIVGGLFLPIYDLVSRLSS